jgi:hypothetical protein
MFSPHHIGTRNTERDSGPERENYISSCNLINREITEMSGYNEDTLRVIKRAQEKGYTAINIDYSGPRIGKKAIGYTVTAKTNGVRVLLGSGSSWDRCYKETMEYLS